MILDSTWRSRIGFVKVRDYKTGEIKVYVGIGEGIDKVADEQFIAEHGSPIAAKQLIEFLKDARN